MTREELQLVGPSQGQIFLISARNDYWGCAGSGPLLQLNRNQTRENDHKGPKLFEMYHEITLMKCDHFRNSKKRAMQLPLFVQNGLILDFSGRLK